MNGKVKWFNDSKGYGFIEAGEKDIFVHWADIKGDGFKTLPEGSQVEFELYETAKGDMARNVTKV